MLLVVQRGLSNEEESSFMWLLIRNHMQLHVEKEGRFQQLLLLSVCEEPSQFLSSLSKSDLQNLIRLSITFINVKDSRGLVDQFKEGLCGYLSPYEEHTMLAGTANEIVTRQPSWFLTWYFKLNKTVSADINGILLEIVNNCTGDLFSILDELIAETFRYELVNNQTLRERELVVRLMEYMWESLASTQRTSIINAISLTLLSIPYSNLSSFGMKPSKESFLISLGLKLSHSNNRKNTTIENEIVEGIALDTIEQVILSRVSKMGSESIRSLLLQCAQESTSSNSTVSNPQISRVPLAQRLLSGIISTSFDTNSKITDLSIVRTVFSVAYALPKSVLDALLDQVGISMANMPMNQLETLCDVLLYYLSPTPPTLSEDVPLACLTPCQFIYKSREAICSCHGRHRLQEVLKRRLETELKLSNLSTDDIQWRTMLNMTHWLLVRSEGQPVIRPLQEKFLGLILIIDDQNNLIETKSDTSLMKREQLASTFSMSNIERHYGGGRNSLLYIHHVLLSRYLTLSVNIKASISALMLRDCRFEEVDPVTMQNIEIQQVLLFLIYSMIVRANALRLEVINYKEQTRTMDDLDTVNGSMTLPPDLIDITTMLDIQRLLVCDYQKASSIERKEDIKEENIENNWMLPFALSSATAVKWLNVTSVFGFNSNGNSRDDQSQNSLPSQFLLFWESRLASLVNSVHLLHCALLFEQQQEKSWTRTELRLVIETLETLFRQILTVHQERLVQQQVFTAIPMTQLSTKKRPMAVKLSDRRPTSIPTAVAVNQETPLEIEKYLQSFNGLQRLAHVVNLVAHCDVKLMREREIERQRLNSQQSTENDDSLTKIVRNYAECETKIIGEDRSSSSEESELDGFNAFKVAPLRLSSQGISKNQPLSVRQRYDLLLATGRKKNYCESVFSQCLDECRLLSDWLHPLNAFSEQTSGHSRLIVDVIRDLKADCIDAFATHENGQLRLDTLQGLSLPSIYNNLRYELLSTLSTSMSLFQTISVESDDFRKPVLTLLSILDMLTMELFHLIKAGMTLRLFKVSHQILLLNSLFVDSVLLLID
jgi:hypothetical protein